MERILRRGSGLRWIARLRARRAERRGRQELERLRLRASTASSSYGPHHYLQAAKRAASLGLRHEALSLYGHAIDGYLETGRGRAAEVVCQEVLAAYPDVVRARRTLALMALGRGEADRAAELVQEYADAARRFGDPRVTEHVLLVMGSIAGSVAPDVPEGRAGSWSRALHAALLRVDELRALPAA